MSIDQIIQSWKDDDEDDQDKDEQSKDESNKALQNPAGEELSDEDLEQAAGGRDCSPTYCATGSLA